MNGFILVHKANIVEDGDHACLIPVWDIRAVDRSATGNGVSTIKLWPPMTPMPADGSQGFHRIEVTETVQEIAKKLELRDASAKPSPEKDNDVGARPEPPAGLRRVSTPTEVLHELDALQKIAGIFNGIHDHATRDRMIRYLAERFT